MKKSIIIIAAVLSLTSCMGDVDTTVSIKSNEVPASTTVVNSGYREGEILEFTHNGIEYTLFSKYNSSSSPIILNKVVK